MPASPSDTASASAAGDDAWRASVQQSFRNSEVRQIAKKLADLEPGASEASKLRLAMQFEDIIFKEAASLADYHKRIAKRLKKLQKNYKPATETAATQRKEQAIQELIAKYGETLQYVCKHEAAAVKEMRAKYGEEKGNQLRQHMDLCKEWAKDLGILPGGAGGTNVASGQPQPHYGMSDGHLERLKQALERRLDTIRSHTVKLVDADQFMQETLQKCESDFSRKNAAIEVQSANARKLYDQILQRVGGGGTAVTSLSEKQQHHDPATMLTQALERASKPVPVLAVDAAALAAKNIGSGSTTPRAGDIRNANTNRNTLDDDRTKAAQMHLDKMREASTVVLAYLLAPDKSVVPKDTLAKAHRIACNGIEFVQDTMRRHRRQQQQQSTIQVRLEDAWLKPLELAPKETAATTTMVDDLDNSVHDDAPVATTPSPSSKPKLPRRLYLRSRVLLTQGRKTPPNLLVAFKDKDVTLVRPPPSGAGSHLYVAFEQAFTMTIYLVPLRCELRAYEAASDAARTNKDSSKLSAADGGSDEDNNNDDDEDDCHRMDLNDQGATWTPLHHGLMQRQELVVGGPHCKGPYEAVGYAVQERLRDASAFATQTLRQCFSNSTASLGATASEFEVEILEASALLEFVQLARDTFLPPPLASK